MELKFNWKYIGFLARFIALLTIMPFLFISLYISTHLSELDKLYFIIGMSISVILSLCVIYFSFKKGKPNSLVRIFATLGLLTMFLASNIWANIFTKLLALF
jgi:hypothetical protein